MSAFQLAGDGLRQAPAHLHEAELCWTRRTPPVTYFTSASELEFDWGGALCVGVFEGALGILAELVVLQAVAGRGDARSEVACCGSSLLIR